MEDEKKVEGEKQEDQEQKAEIPSVITRSMAEAMEGCETCEVAEPALPQNLPEPGWSTQKLVEALKDKHMLIRSNAVMLLSKRSPEEATEPLIEALKDDDYMVKSNAMVALASFGKTIESRMIEALSDQDPAVRAGAAWVLGEFKDPKAIEPLEKAAKDENPLVRVQAKASLQAMGRWPQQKQGSKKQEQPEELPAEEEKTEGGEQQGQ